MFEEYFRELLETYVAPDSFVRIEESNERKRADWKLLLGNWKLLIEQKCPLVKLSAKQQEVDVDAVNDFCNKQIIKAIRQLHMTESDFGDGPYVKVILLYEDYLYEAFLQVPEDLSDTQVEFLLKVCFAQDAVKQLLEKWVQEVRTAKAEAEAELAQAESGTEAE